MVLLGIDLGSNEIRVHNGNSNDDIIRDQNILKLDNAISFHESSRLYGSNARKCLFNEYGCNTFVYLKWLLGKKTSSNHLESFVEQSLIYKKHILSSSPDERLCFRTSDKIKYFNSVHTFYADELYTMILKNLQKQLIANMFLEDDEPIKCVISVPFHYNAIERKCLLNCCQLANVECVSLVNDTTAISVFFAITKKNLLNSDPKLVIIVDCGETSLQICYTAIWDTGVKILYNYTIDDFGGKQFDYRLYQKCCESECYKSIKTYIPESLLKATVFRECEKAKISGFSSPIELRFNKDASITLFNEDFEQACSDLFFTFAKHLRNSYEEFAKLYKLPSNDPSKTDAMSLLLCGATMKLAKLKDIANSIFRMQGKFLQKDTVSKGCMIIANMITNSRKQKFTIVDNISHDILILGANTMNTLVTCQTQLPSKFLLKNVSFEERFKIVLDKKIEYGEFHIKLKNSKTKLNFLSWKLSINSQGVIEKFVPICFKIDENNQECIDFQSFTYDFQSPVIEAINKNKLIKKMKTFERLESFQENGNQERLSLQNFIFQSVELIQELSNNMPCQKKTEILTMLEDEEKWLLDDEAMNPTLCIAKLELLKKTVGFIKKQKDIYDECLIKLEEYKNVISNRQSTAKKYYDEENKNQGDHSRSLEDFEYKIFCRLVEDHQKFYQKFKENISDKNILEIIISPETVQEKINLFCKEFNEIIQQSELKRRRAKEEAESRAKNDIKIDEYYQTESEDECSDNTHQYNKIKRIRIKAIDDDDTNNKSGEDSDDYEALDIKQKEDTEIYEPLKHCDSESENERDNTPDRKNKNLKIPVNTKNLTIKGTEISKKISFNIKLNKAEILKRFPIEWDLNVKMDRKEYKVEIHSKEIEFEMIKEKFKPMNDLKSILIKVWRVQNENLWNNYFLKKKSVKPHNEQELFYGCDGAYFKHVCENNCQFRRSTYKCPDYGLGVYFYKNITDAHRNVKPYYRCYYMFICKVILGKTILGSESISNLHKGYHSGTNKKGMNNSTIFVIPKLSSNQIYPLYLLAYEVK